MSVECLLRASILQALGLPSSPSSLLEGRDYCALCFVDEDSLWLSGPHEHPAVRNSGQQVTEQFVKGVREPGILGVASDTGW